MKSNYCNVLGSKMHYREIGEGKPILFLHGNPTSSYLWRNIIPFLESEGRCIALDLIGMGRSGKPDIDYRFIDHYKYVAEFIKQMDLSDVLLVLHDWGSALGFFYFHNHRDNVRGLAFMEAFVKVHESYEAMGDGADFFKPLRDPETGPRLILKKNIFIEQVLPGGIMRKLTNEEFEVYREPFRTEESRKPLLLWPNEVPIGGVPSDVAGVVTSYMESVKTADIPKILIYADPGAVISLKDVNYLKENVRNLQSVCVGGGFHFLQEDRPEEIGEALSKWYRAELL